MRQDNGTYTPVAKMQMPYDNAEAAWGACEALLLQDKKLKAVKAKKRAPNFVGTTP